MARKKSAAAVALGRKGGANSRKNLTPERRAELARRAVAARWNRVPETEPSHPLEPIAPREGQLIMDGARREFLAVCWEKLNIPHEVLAEKVYPHFVEHPNRSVAEPTIQLPPFTPPAWDLRTTTEVDYRRDLEFCFRLYADALIADEKNRMIAKGWKFSAVHRNKQAPLEARYQWTAERLCYDLSYKEIAEDAHKKTPHFLTPGQDAAAQARREGTVRKAIQDTLAELGISTDTRK
jgi:hypothetical protein